MFNFGGTNNSTQPKPATITGTTGFNLGGATTTTTTATATPSTFSFGAETATTTTASTGFSLGGATTTTASGGLFGGATTAATTTTTASGGLFGGATATTTATTAPAKGGSLFGNTTGGGLFGNTRKCTTTAPTTTPASLTAPTTTKPGLGGTGTVATSDASKTETQQQQPAKQQTLPKEIKELVTGLEGFIKKEKEESNKVAKYSQRDLNKVKENADQLEIVIKSLKSSLQREGSSVKKLSEKAVELHNGVAMAQRTNDTHAALQHENFLPSRYFAELIKDFESTLTVYRAQIDNLESHLAAGNESIISQLPNSLERLHQTFIALAANLQIILGQVDKMKQRYLAYRRQQGDTTDPFAKKKQRSEKALVGPSPFAELSNLNVLALAQIQSQQQMAAPAATNTTTNTTGGLFGNTTTNTTSGGLFGNTSTTGGGLFGNTAKPTTSGGLFGNTSTTGTTGGGLFGNTTTSSTSGGLFGNTNTAAAKPAFSFNNTTKTQSGSLFGNTSSFSFGAKK